MKSVNEEEFYQFIKKYPNKLEFDSYGNGSGLYVTYLDVSLGEWPDIIIASHQREPMLSDKADYDFQIREV